MVVLGDWLFPSLERDTIIALIYLPMGLLYFAVYRWVPPFIERLDEKLKQSLKPPG